MPFTNARPVSICVVLLVTFLDESADWFGVVCTGELPARTQAATRRMKSSVMEGDLQLPFQSFEHLQPARMRAGALRQPLGNVLLERHDGSPGAFRERDADGRVLRPFRVMPLAVWCSGKALRVCDCRSGYQPFGTTHLYV